MITAEVMANDEGGANNIIIIVAQSCSTISNEWSIMVTFSGWFHDPSTGRVTTKLLNKDVIVSRKHKGHRNEI